MKKSVILLLSVSALIIFVSGCSENETVTIDHIRSALDNENINYEEMDRVPELRKSDYGYSYRLDEGRLRVHFFSSETDRIEVQNDPYPAASFCCVTAHYSKEKVLIYYMEGNTELTTKLDRAFDDWDKINMYNH